MNTDNCTFGPKLSLRLRAMCAAVIFVFGLGLIASVLIFPVVKGRSDWLLVLSGYTVILAALVLLVISVRLGWVHRFECMLCAISQRQFLVALFGVSLVLRLLGIMIFQVELYGDPAQNELKAWNIYQGLGYIGYKGPDPHWTPGYVSFAAAVYALTGRFPIALMIANCLLDSLTTVLVYRLAGRFWDEPKARLSGVLYAINPALIITTQVITYGPLLGTLLITLCLSVKRKAAIVGLLFGITALVKPIVLPGPLLTAVVDMTSGLSLGKAVKRFGIVVLVMLLTITPWTLRNYMTFDRFLLISANSGWILWWGNNPNTNGVMMDWTEEQKAVRGADLIELDRRLGHEAVVWILENPLKFLALIPVKQAHTWGTEVASLPRLEHCGYILEQTSRVITQLFYVALALAAGYGLMRYAASLVLVPELLMACLLLVLAWLIHSVYIGWSLYHQPFLPFLTVIAVGYLSSQSSRHEAAMSITSKDKEASLP